jgi:Arc/MetJ-type ribon-helix-helix transcriptional regulator
MATSTSALNAELEAFAAPLIATGEFPDTAEVLHAAINALRSQREQRAYDEACIRAAEEGEASGLAEGDIFATVRAKYGLKSYLED